MTAVYSAPGWWRLAVALAYAVVVTCVVWAMESSTEQPPAPLAQAAPVAADATAILVESTYPVARWTVLVDGRAVMGTTTATTWSGSVNGREILIQAERADAVDRGPLMPLRLYGTLEPPLPKELP